MVAHQDAAFVQDSVPNNPEILARDHPFPAGDQNRLPVFDRRFVRGKFKFHRAGNPGHGEDPVHPELSTQALDGIRTVREFDSRYTAPHNGFRDVDDYYTRASAAPLLGSIRIPTLAIHALDDPLVPAEPLQRAHVLDNPWIVRLLPRHGGHVGFVGKTLYGDVDERWAENRLIEFFLGI